MSLARQPLRGQPLRHECAQQSVQLGRFSCSPRKPRSGGAFANRYFVVIVVSALLCAPIHRSAWNRNSQKFAFWVFSEVSPYGVLRSSAIMQNHGGGSGPSGGRPFALYASEACISERLWAHITTTKKIG